MPVLPFSLTAILSLLGAAFTAPTAQTLEALFAGFVGRVGEHTVCGMWQAARLAGRLHHSRAHDFFARARWSADELGLLLLDLLVARFVDPESPLRPCRRRHRVRPLGAKGARSGLALRPRRRAGRARLSVW